MTNEDVGVVEVEATQKGAEKQVEVENGERNGEADENASGSVSTSPSTSREGLRKMSGRGKIANLRAAFEKTDEGTVSHPSPGSTPRRAASRDHEASTALLKEQHAQEIARLREEHEAALVQSRAHQQQEISQVAEQLEKEVELRHAYEEKCTALEDRIDSLLSELSAQSTLHQADTDRHSSEAARAQEETSTLHRQVLDLKRTIASATRVGNQVSDSTFSQEFQNLCHEVQNWIVNHFRRIKVEKSPETMVARLESIAEPKQLDYLRPIYNRFDSSIKILAFQATAACYMMEIWEEPLLFGLPTQHDFRKGLKRAAETLPSVLPPATFNKWRATTFDALLQAEGIAESTDSAVASLSEMICITLNTLADAEGSHANLSSLNAIVKRAVTLSHLFKVQRAQYQFRLPHSGEAFVPETMEDISVDAEPGDGRVVQCATFPSVVKLGDEEGDNVEISNIIVKANVVLHND